MSVPELKPHPNGTWYIHWTEGRRSKRVSTGTKSLDEAQKFFGHWLILENTAPKDAAAGALFTVEEIWSVYWKRHFTVNVLPENQKVVEYEWVNLKAHFGALTVPLVTQAAADDYRGRRMHCHEKLANLGRKVGASTVRKELSLLCAAIAFGAAAPQNLYDPAIVKTIKLPAAAEPRDRWLRTPEIARLMEGARTMRRKVGDNRIGRTERFLWLALETAARKQAILDLEWDRVDFEKGLIDYQPSWRKRTKKRRPVVPISERLMPVLRAAYEQRDGDFVCDHRGAIWASVQRAAIRAGFAGRNTTKIGPGERPKATGVSPHVLRHTAATHMARNGVPLWIVAKCLGDTLAVVEKVYAKHQPEDLRAAFNTIATGRQWAA